MQSEGEQAGEGSERSAHAVLLSLGNTCSWGLPPFSSHPMDGRGGFSAIHFSSYMNLPNENPTVLFTGLGLDKLRKEMREFRKSVFTMPVLNSLALK